MCSHEHLKTRVQAGGIAVQCSYCGLLHVSEKLSDESAIDEFLALSKKKKRHNVHDIHGLTENNLDK